MILNHLAFQCEKNMYIEALIISELGNSNGHINNIESSEYLRR